MDRVIRDVGGIPQILKGLTIEAERRANKEVYEQGKEQFAKPSSTPRSSLGGAMSLLKKRRSMIEQAAPVAQMVVPSGDVEGNVAQDIAASNIQDDAMDPQGTHDLAGFQAMQRQQAQQLRQNAQRQKPRWTDPQPGAVRISAIDEDAGPSQRGKRTHAEMEEGFDPTQDEGFQTDTRDIAAADQRRREVSFARPKVDYITGLEVPDDSHEPSPSKRQRLNPGSSIPYSRPFDENEGDLEAGEMYRRAKDVAKFDRVAASQSKPSRARQPWTDAEESALLTLIEQHGTEGVSYSALKAIDREGDNVLARRSAEDLRFKARNMKLTLLKGNRGQRGLPANWEHVKLDKKAMDQLASLNIPYEQERSRGV